MKRLHRSCPRPRRWLALLACGLAPALAACSGAAAQVQLPPKATTSTASTASTATARAHHALTQQQRVLAAFFGYTAALRAANLSLDPARARRLLRPYLPAERVARTVQAERSMWANGERFYGQDVQHVLSVRIEGQYAFVHDCDNTSAMGLKYAKTGQPVPGMSGIPDVNIVTKLDLVRGHWLIQFQLLEDVPCAG